MNLIGNLIWFIFGGFIAALLWFIAGLLLCVTIIGIPIGMQFFKFARLVLFPFGKEIQINFDRHPILNIIWAILFGWEMMIGYLGIAALFAITIIGIPFAIQWVKLSMLALLPFGAEVNYSHTQ
jgi:uncharacterized membrane protein YccF (DUF307 family)